MNCEPEVQKTAGESGASPESSSRERLRALFVIPRGTMASSYIFSKRQASMLQLEGVETTMFFVESRTSPRVVLRELRRLRGEIRVFRPHVIHAQYGTMNAFLCALAGRGPLVITFRGSDLNPVPSYNRVRIAVGHFLSQLAALRAAAIISVSSELHERLWWGRNRAEVIVGGVNLELFAPMSRTEARRKLGWDDGWHVVLFNAGREPVVKRLDLAEAAFAELQKRDTRARMITVRGNIDPDTMPVYYNAADCLLITSDSEGSPTVLKEALACNLPIVSVNVGDAEERLMGVTPSAIAPRDPEKLALAMEAVLAQRRRSNGRSAVAALSEHLEVRRIRALYDSVVAGK